MESALDRFARTRGAALVGASAMGRQWKIQTWVGGSLVGVASTLALVAALPGVPHEMAYGALGPGIAGLTNLGFGLYFRKAAKAGRSVLLSDEAASLLRALVLRAQVWQGGWRPRKAPMHGPHAWPGYKAPAQPSPVAMAALELAATAYNRIADALGDAKDERSARLRAAADAGMGEALHQAATNASPDETVARLAEMADLVERAIERPETPSALRSNLEATLQELRAEDEARQELRE